MRNPTVGMLRSIFAFTALFAVAGAHAQTKITIETANSVNKQILAVSFAPPAPPGHTTVLNTDLSSVIRIESLALGTNPNTNSIDLFAADNLNHNILRYASNFTVCPSPPSPACTVGTPVVPQSTIPYPNGLSLDNAFNLFVVNNQPGSSPTPQVFALSQWNNNTGTFQTVTRIDKPGSLGKMQAVVETMIVATPLGTITQQPGQPPVGSVANVGDLLVVSQSPNEILIYPGSNGHGPLTQSTLATPTVLIPQCPKGKNPPPCIPATSAPGGIAVWPADHSLVVTTFNGPILQFPTASGVITAPATIVGAPSGLYKVNTAINSGEAGGAVGFVAQSGPGNHGSILELIPGAGGGIQVSSSTVTANVFAPQAIAVTNTQQAPYASCLVPPGTPPGSVTGCDLLGHNINTYKTRQKSDPPGGPNLVESLCVVAMDPRFATTGCPVPGSTVRINDVCPNFDTTLQGMVVPDYACGTPGFALIKSQTDHTQGEFNLTYTDSLQDPSTLFSGVPMCGPGGTAAVFWAPNGGETLIEEEVPFGGSITNPGQAGLAPTLVDTTEGCWGDPGPGGGHPLTSVFATGLAFLPPDLQGFVGKNYGYLQSTITQLATGGNVNSGVASQLTNNSTGCVDVSLSLYNKARAEGPDSGPPTQQQIYDFQDAADLLSNADATGTTTCDSILTTNETPANFTENPATQVFNPSGQIEWRFAEISNAIRMRILGQPPAATWPTPVSLSVSPQYMFGSLCVPNQCPQVMPAETMTATLSWALVNDPALNSCSWSGTTDSNVSNSSPPSVSGSGSPPTVGGSVVVGPFTPPVVPSPAATYTYELTCNVPAATVPSNTVTLTAAPSGSGYTGGTLTATWPGSTGANYQVTLYNSQTPPAPIQTISPCMFTSNSTHFSCPSTNITGTPTATIEVSRPFSATTYLTVWPAIAIQANPSAVAAGTPVTITWTTPAGATGCQLITSGNNLAGFTGNLNGSGAPPFVASYTPSPADEGNTVTFTAYCSAGASAGIASITVWSPVVVVVPTSPPYVPGNVVTITWAPPAGATTCSLTTSGDNVASFTGATSGNSGGTAQYTPDATDVGNNVTFTGSCAAGASAGSASIPVTSS